MTRIWASLALASLIALLACGRESPPGEAPSPQPAVAPSPEPAAVEAKPNAPKHPVLDAYEQVRAQLARDAIAEGIAGGKAIGTAASEAQASATEALKPKLEAVTKAATAFAAMPADDANAARKAFGEVSRATVALVNAEPTLKEGRHVFECPMAQGYEKWVQVSDEIENPYMGTEMLACGGKTTWGP
jgi:hypothetical protein